MDETLNVDESTQTNVLILVFIFLLICNIKASKSVKQIFLNMKKKLYQGKFNKGLHN